MWPHVFCALIKATFSWSNWSDKYFSGWNVGVLRNPRWEPMWVNRASSLIRGHGCRSPRYLKWDGWPEKLFKRKSWYYFSSSTYFVSNFRWTLAWWVPWWALQLTWVNFFKSPAIPSSTFMDFSYTFPCWSSAKFMALSICFCWIECLKLSHTFVFSSLNFEKMSFQSNSF